MTRRRPLAIPAIIAAGIRRAEKERPKFAHGLTSTESAAIGTVRASSNMLTLCMFVASYFACRRIL